MGSPYVCGTCSGTFSSSSHLRRHEASHLSSKSYDCYFCDRSFLRMDTARRHAKTCPKRSGQPIPRTQKRGKRRTSCDYCARGKFACDQCVPCGQCKSNALTCTYTRLVPNRENNQPPRPRVSYSERDRTPDSTRTGQTASEPAGSLDALLKVRVPFLVNYTCMGHAKLDMYTAFEAGTLKPDQHCRTAMGMSRSVNNDLEVPQSALFDGGMEEFPFILLPRLNPWHLDPAQATPEESTADPGYGLFAERTEEVIQALRHVTKSLRGSQERASADLDTAINQGLFSVTNMIDFTRLYMRHFHRHLPIFHAPSFRVYSASVPLLLAIFMGGALLSRPRDTYQLAVDCFDLAEEYIFSLPIFEAGYRSTRSFEQHACRLIEPLLAAAILITLQLGRNDSEIRRRVNSQRFPTMVHAARSLSLFQNKHEEKYTESASGYLAFTQQESFVR
ncbi:hypothetical protein BBP40_002020 [Aspergillus hancockii]|nr:hypothetical protein BBP40_002020 [Aspergillus hancockii]